MNVVVPGGYALAGERRVAFLVAPVCVCAAIAPLAARWIPDATLRTGFGLLLAAAYLGLWLVAGKRSALAQYRELALALFVLALVQVMNNVIPGYVATVVLHDPPKPGNPFASTIGGTVIVQLVETAIAVVPVVAFARLSRDGLAGIYVRPGKRGWLLFAVAFFLAFAVFLARVALRSDSVAQQLLPTTGPMSIPRLLGLAPALVVTSLSNGFEEELLFRGLFLQKYTHLFGPRAANLLQALVFGVAHVSISYTPDALLFLILVVFPLGLLAGYLMMASKSVLTPSIVHGALDMAIYLVFLTAVT